MIRFIQNLIQYRELLFSLTLSELKTKYKQSFLGIGWAVLQPVALTSISVFIFSYLAKMPSDEIPYPLFAYTALLQWTLCSTAVSFAIPTLVQNRQLLRRVYFPREIFVVSAILGSLVDYGVAWVIFLGMLTYYQIPMSGAVFYFPLILFVQLFLIAGISLLGSILNVAFRDVAKTIPILLQMGMLLCPIVYPLSMIPERLKPFYVLNPMVGIIDSCRRIFLEGTAPHWPYLLISAGVSLAVFSAGYWTFKKGEQIIADVI